MSIHALRSRTPRLPRRCVALVLAAAQGFGLGAIPVSASSDASFGGQAQRRAAARVAPPALPARVAVNRTRPNVEPPRDVPTFSASPTSDEITRARVFDEVLVPTGDVTSRENRALADAIVVYRKANEPEATAPIEAFLTAFPQSAWRASLRVNLGRIAGRRGALSVALGQWEEAWLLTKDGTSPGARAVADAAMSERLAFAAQLGNETMLARWLEEAGTRSFSGPAADRVARAKAVLALKRGGHDTSPSCGRTALALLWPLVSRGEVPASLTRAGTNDSTLHEVRDLAGHLGLEMDAVVRPVGSDPVVPSIVHWSIGHYSLLVRTDGVRYLVRDPAFGGEVWMTREAFDQEASGFMLVPRATRPAEWRAATGEEGRAIVGRSGCPVNPPNPNDPCDECSGAGGPGGGGGNGGGSGPPPSCGSGSCSAGGMPVYSFHPVSAALQLTDTPVGYAPPRGPSVFFTLRYDSRQRVQPAVRPYGHVGPQWTHIWLGYVSEAPAYCDSGTSTTNYCYPAKAEVFLRGGGTEIYDSPDASGVFPRHYRVQAQLVRVSSSPIRYERRLPGGEVEVFGLSDTAPAGQRRVFLTEVRDAQGQSVTLTYDSEYRLVALTDAIGQVTLVAYEDAGDSRRVTKVTDPFGRFARFTYTAAGQLETLTDTIGLTSRLRYGPDDTVVLLTTPYGTTSFEHGGDYYSPTIQATDAAGGTERLEYRWLAGPWAASDPDAEVPPGFSAANVDLNRYTSVYWDQRAWAAGPGVVANATQTKWLSWSWLPYTPVETVRVPHSVKRPLERRVWYAYPGQTSASFVGTSTSPSVTARVLEDGSVQRTQATYNVQGSVLSRTDPLGRQTTYTYAANGVDLLEVRQQKPGGYDLLAQYGSYTSGHQPQAVTDAAGQTTTFTYTAAGQVLTSTNAKQETTTYVYDADGRLQSVTGALPGTTTTYTYDGYGRLQTITGPDGYTTTTTYDLFDRVQRMTYPDGTYEETTYDRLDPKTRRDRLGRVTQYVYDELRRLRATRDPAGRTITRGWTLGICPGCAGRDTLIDAKGQTTTWERDVQGRVVREVRADGVTATSYAYEPASGRLHAVTDPKFQVTTYTYHLDDSVQQIAFTNSQIATPSVSYSYDPVYSRVATMVDGTGTTAYTYHPAGVLGAGQVASVDGPLTDDTITYTYDELGRVLSRAINGAANTTTQAYDALGRVTAETNVLGTFTYGYVGVTGRLQTVAYPNGQTSEYAYYPAAQDLRLQTIHHRRPGGATLSKFDYTYDVTGNILTWQEQADGNAPTVWVYGYDRADQLTSAVKQTTDPTPTIINRYAYSYDPAGNRTSEQIDDAVTLATHDNLNRLLTHQPGGPLVFKGSVTEPARVTINGQPASVDAQNRFTGIVPAVPGTTTVTINAVDPSGNASEAVYEVDQAGTSKTFTYDANGNMTSDGTRTFEWDARNQLVGVNVGTHRTEFGYDGLQRRVREIEKENGLAQSETNVLWCETVICEERGPDGTTVTRRALGHGEQVGGDSRSFATDHLGSVREVTNPTVALLARYAFDPWGRRMLAAGNDVTSVGFTGHRPHTGSALALTLYRGYDPGLGRWNSEDPLGITAGPNLYAYVSSMPTTRFDPLGLKECKDFRISRPGTPDIGFWTSLKHRLGGPANSLTWTEVKCPPAYPKLEKIQLVSDGEPPYSPDEHRWPNWSIVQTGSSIRVDVPTRTVVWDRKALARVRLLVTCCKCN